MKEKKERPVTIRYMFFDVMLDLIYFMIMLPLTFFKSRKELKGYYKDMSIHNKSFFWKVFFIYNYHSSTGDNKKEWGDYVHGLTKHKCEFDYGNLIGDNDDNDGHYKCKQRGCSFVETKWMIDYQREKVVPNKLFKEKISAFTQPDNLFEGDIVNIWNLKAYNKVSDIKQVVFKKYGGINTIIYDVEHNIYLDWGVEV